jgi:hypothetical protein
MKFKYVAMNGRAVEEEGEIEAEDHQRAILEIQEKGLYPVSITPIEEDETRQSPRDLKKNAENVLGSVFAFGRKLAGNAVAAATDPENQAKVKKKAGQAWGSTLAAGNRIKDSERVQSSLASGKKKLNEGKDAVMSKLHKMKGDNPKED